MEAKSNNEQERETFLGQRTRRCLRNIYQGTKKDNVLAGRVHSSRSDIKIVLGQIKSEQGGEKNKVLANLGGEKVATTGKSKCTRKENEYSDTKSCSESG